MVDGMTQGSGSRGVSEQPAAGSRPTVNRLVSSGLDAQEAVSVAVRGGTTVCLSETHPLSAPDPALAAYAARAREYEEAVGRIEHVDAADLEFVGDWARGVEGKLLDVGSGPGQWTDWLRTSGVTAEGVDPVSEFVELARATYPESRYRVGWAEALEEADAAAGGILAWYSLIHTAPDAIDRALAEFARVLRPGGGVLLGFFTAEHQRCFNHAIAPAFTWPVPLLAERLERHGFEVRGTVVRVGRPERAHGAIIARRRPARSGESPIPLEGTAVTLSA